MTNREDFTYFHQLRVRWGECDAQGIVFNPNYFSFFDIAFTEYMREMFGEISPEVMPELYAVRAEADYRGSAVFDDLVDIGVRCARIGRTSIAYEFCILRDDMILTTGRMTYVHAVAGTQDKAPVPQELIGKIVDFERIAPEGV